MCGYRVGPQTLLPYHLTANFPTQSSRTTPRQELSRRILSRCFSKDTATRAELTPDTDLDDFDDNAAILAVLAAVGQDKPRSRRPRCLEPVTAQPRPSSHRNAADKERCGTTAAITCLMNWFYLTGGVSKSIIAEARILAGEAARTLRV